MFKGHVWGDNSVDWKGIDACVTIISSICRIFGRLGGQAKEKYGEIRFYAHFGNLSLHTLIYPGHVFTRFSPWLSHFDETFLSIIFWRHLERPFVWWQQKVYSFAYWRALKKYPHLRAEILCGADFPELIKGVTQRDGNKLHILGWNGEILSTWETL